MLTLMISFAVPKGCPCRTLCVWGADEWSRVGVFFIWSAFVFVAGCFRAEVRHASADVTHLENLSA